jgi:hypothetical protein
MLLLFVIFGEWNFSKVWRVYACRKSESWLLGLRLQRPGTLEPQALFVPHIRLGLLQGSACGESTVCGELQRRS